MKWCKCGYEVDPDYHSRIDCEKMRELGNLITQRDADVHKLTAENARLRKAIEQHREKSTALALNSGYEGVCDIDTELYTALEAK